MEQRKLLSDSNVKSTISLSKVRLLLIYTVVVLVVMNLIGLYFKYFLNYDYIFGFIPKFNLDTENNIPTYFSSLLLLTASFLLYTISKVMKKHCNIYAYYWLYLSIIFFCLSVDEAASIHELLIKPLKSAFNFSGVLYYSWVSVGFVSVIIIAIIYLRFLLELPKNTKIMFFLSACVYISGALGVELIGGFYASNYGDSNVVYELITTMEEMLEMTGIVIFINALIKFMIINKVSIQLDISE